MQPHSRQSCHLLTSIFLLLALLTQHLGAQEKFSSWPQLRGPGGQGVSADKNVPTTWSDKENLVWKFEVPGPGASTPIVVGKRIYLTYFTGYNTPGKPRGDIQQLKLHVLCLERDTTRTLWTREIAPKLPEQASIRENHGYASSTPVIDAERLYCFFGKSGVHAFDLEGNPLWQADVGSKLNGWGSAASPMLYGDLVIINASVESDSLIALDKKTGKEVWRAGGIRESWNTPILVPVPGGKTELVVAIMGKILGFDPATGTQLWSCATDIPWYMVPCLVAHDGVVYAIGGRNPGGGLAVRAGGQGNVTASHRLWKINKASNVASPVIHEGHLYWMHDGLGVVYCAEAKTGKIVYEERIPRGDPIYSCAVLADGKIYFFSRLGRTYVVPARPKFELMATNALSDRSTFNASPAVAGSRLYLRSDRFLYCMGRP